MEITPRHWATLKARAQITIDQTVAELPPEVRIEAQKVPCLFEPENAEDPELLGLYCDFAPGEVSESRGPIILYLATIEAFCLEDGEDFDDEVRLTFLHELGHHLGWDEDDLEARGLG